MSAKADVERRSNPPEGGGRKNDGFNRAGFFLEKEML